MSAIRRQWIEQRWKFVPIIMLCGSVASAYTMVTLSMGDGTGTAVEPDYYRKAAAWDETQRQLAANGALNWIVTPSFAAGMSDPRLARLEIAVADKYAVALDGARVHAEVIPIRAADARCELDLSPTGNGRYAIDVPIRTGGLWEVRLRVESKGRVYTDRFRRQLMFGPSPPHEVSK